MGRSRAQLTPERASSSCSRWSLRRGPRRQSPGLASGGLSTLCRRRVSKRKRQEGRTRSRGTPRASGFHITEQAAGRGASARASVCPPGVSTAEPSPLGGLAPHRQRPSTTQPLVLLARSLSAARCLWSARRPPAGSGTATRDSFVPNALARSGHAEAGRRREGWRLFSCDHTMGSAGSRRRLVRSSRRGHAKRVLPQRLTTSRHPP